MAGQGEFFDFDERLERLADYGAIRARGLSRAAKAAFERGCEKLVEFANA